MTQGAGVDMPEGAGGVRVLVVEDETALAQVLRAGLTDEGFAVDVQTRGSTGCGRPPSTPTT